MILYPVGNEREFALDLSEEGGASSAESYVAKSRSLFVFSDKEYYFDVSFQDSSISLRSVKVYINDVFEPSELEDGRIVFRDENSKDRLIFSDCYGFVKIGLRIITADESVYHYVSDYVPVLVRDTGFNDSVRAMVSYVYSNQETLLLNGEVKASAPEDLKEKGVRNLSSQTMLLGEIASSYELNYGFFKANSRFRIVKRNRIDSFEHLQYVTPEAVRYISTHPEELVRVSGDSGIRIGNSLYQPRNTLSEHNELSLDIYENRVVLGFLLTMIRAVDDMYLKCQSLLSSLPECEYYGGDYIYSSFFMFNETKKSLLSEREELERLKVQFSRLYTMYSSIFNIRTEPVAGEPESTHIFLSIPQYNRLFIQIHKWFTYGVYNFERERFMLSFIKVSSMYEGYLLVKMINYFKSRDYILEGVRKCIYPIGKNSRYKNTGGSNTYVFSRGKRRITLYYQPVIFGSDSYGFNGIGLMRNNSISLIDDDTDASSSGGGYYSPDYIIKVENDENSRYLILDAKFSTFNTVKKTYVMDLAFKYLFSISPVKSSDCIIGLCLLYGKCSIHDESRSAYDNQLPGQHIRPVVEIVPMMEGIKNEEHYSRLDAVMKEIT